MKEVGNKYKPALLESYSVDNGVKFTLREQHYISLAATGLNMQKCALEMRCSLSTVKRILAGNPNVSKAVEAIKQMMISEVAERRRAELEEFYDIAQSSLKKLLKDKNPWVKMNAMRMVFDRYDKLMQVANEEDNKIAVIFEGMAVPPTKNVTIEGSMEDE